PSAGEPSAHRTLPILKTSPFMAFPPRRCRHLHYRTALSHAPPPLFRCEAPVRAGGINNLASHDGQQRFDVSNVLRRHCQDVAGEDGKIGEPAGSKNTAFAVFERKPRTALR